jgi:hypothetical protein
MTAAAGSDPRRGHSTATFTAVHPCPPLIGCRRRALRLRALPPDPATTSALGRSGCSLDRFWPHRYDNRRTLIVGHNGLVRVDRRVNDERACGELRS